MLRFLIPSYLLSVLLENLSGGLRGLGDVLWPTIFTFGGSVLCKASVDHNSYEDSS